jgi:hypothetical protein
MTTQANISMREGETWNIEFTAHKADGSVLPLVSGAEVLFRIEGIVDDTAQTILTMHVGDGILITDDLNGAATIQVTTDQQEAADLTSGGLYYYEIQTIVDDSLSVQAEGRLTIERSLFSQAVDPLLMAFQAHFPEFTEDDSTIQIYLKEAKSFVDTSGNVDWSADDSATATIYLAAHFLQMKKLASLLSDTGGIELGQVKSITVEDRTVSFATPSTSNRGSGNSASQLSLSNTVYGQRFLALLRNRPRFLMRA